MEQTTAAPRLHGPKLTDFPKYPVITIVSLMAIGVTLAWWMKIDVSALFEAPQIRHGQLWRLLTSVLPHLDLLHLIFNLWWLWILGTTVERVLGHLNTVLLFLLFAIGPNALQYAFSDAGAGLSGIGYGLFGLLWVLSHRDPRFAKTLDERTVSLFVGWFFLCIFLTLNHTWEVANFAHGGGALLGVLVGFAITNPKFRVALSGGVVAIVVFGLWGATFGRAKLNLSNQAGLAEGYLGYTALQNDKNQEAVQWLQEASVYRPKDAGVWYDLGIGYERMGNRPAAKAAYEKAVQLKPNEPDYQNAVRQMD
jgi:membrane associated rhomboid family serine protease